MISQFFISILHFLSFIQPLIIDLIPNFLLNFFLILFKISECNNKRYGRNCKQPCGTCLNKAQCNPFNGTCMNGCDIGFRTPRCKGTRPKLYCFAPLNSDLVFSFSFNPFILLKKKIRQLVAYKCEYSLSVKL